MQILKLIFFGTYNSVDIISELLLSLSLIALFRKCKVKWWWALVPFIRAFFLGKCGDREPEGRVCAVIDALNGILLGLLYYTHSNSFQYFSINALIASLGFISLFNHLKIYPDSFCF